MKDQVIEFNPDFSTLARDDWFDALDEFCEEHGYFEPLGNGYAAGLIDSGPKLLVTFETYETICKSDAKRRIDLVEVAPDYDPTGSTAILAAQVLMNLLGFVFHARSIGG